ncbi:MAG: AAA family ATPase [Polyangiaceae bacterium]|nr:AAA family ATPase [Polyangiaceae bacterium]
MSQPSSYTLVEPFSKGTGTILYRAVRCPDHLPVILKVIDPRRHRPKDRERLKNEYEIEKSLDGRLVVRPLALDTYEGMPALVFPDLGGQSLDRLLGAPMEIPRFLELSIRIAECVEGIHAQGIVHKDLKPGNILIDPTTGEAKVADFGLASRLTREQHAAQAPRLIEGSLPYMSPEQTGRMNRAVDSRADLYALGVTFYEMLSGRLPFLAQDPVEWVHCHVARPVAALSEVAPWVPDVISRIVTKLLAKMPEDRYETARGLRHDLERCLGQWKSRGKIEPFILGEHDVSDRLQIPQKLYGRGEDVAALLRGFEHVIEQACSELLLVSGYAGIGKSALVHELHKPVVREHGLFASGKFDQYKRGIPYFTFVQAFQDLALDILAESEERIAAWRGRLVGALGVNAQLIVDVIPHIELVIGPQPPVVELPPAEAQNRFRIVLRQFIGVFAQKDHPLAIFLDDLQWADSASLELLKDLVTHPDMQFLFVVGAYRDNEVTPAHPLSLMLNEAQNQGAQISNIVLGPLSLDDLTTFVGEALHCRREEAWPLAALVHDKTAGNPFFAIQLLTSLYEEGLLEFDTGRGAWRWDLARIREKGLTDNVVDLMVSKLKRLPAATQEALQQVAALGNTAEASILSIVRGCSEEETNAALWEAVRSGLLLRFGEASYGFLHDRVHEAAYALIPEDARPLVHLRIGRILVSHLPPDALLERVFDVVNQLDRGIDLVTDPREKALLRDLNFRAGKKSKAAIAYVAARSYLDQAAALSPEEAWHTDYEDTFALHLDLAECEYLVGNFERADELFDLLLTAARAPLDRAKVYGIRSRLCQLAGRYDASVTASWDALRLFGVSIPESEEELRAATEAELREIPINLAGRRIADIVDAKEVTDPAVGTLLTFLAEAMAPAYIARPAYLPLLTAKAVNLSLRHGNQAESCLAYSSYAVLLVSMIGDISSGFEFSEMSMRLNEKLDDRKLRGKILVIHGDHVHAWKRPFATVFPYLDRSLRASLEVGDLVWASYLAFVITWLVFEKGDPLDEVLRVSRRYATFAKQSHNDVVHATIRLEQQFVASLKGRTRAPASFDDATFDEASCLAVVVEASFGSGIFYHHVAKQLAAFTFGFYAEALASAERAAETVGNVMGMAIEATYHFYLALTLTALFPKASVDDQRRFEQDLGRLLSKLELWADNCPENYLNRYALVSAEVARIHGRNLDAERLYQEAIDSARKAGLVQNEALAYELASAFYRGRGFVEFADTYLREARARYARWGADGKVRQIDQQHPVLLERLPLAATATFAAPAEQLDLLSVVKASQAISGELVLDQLIRTLLRVVLEQGGAQKGYLILSEGDVMSVTASATLRDGAVVTEIVPSTPVDGFSHIAASVVQYARLMKEHVIIEDAAKEAGRFAADAYLCRNKPRSVLALPILRQAKVLGLLYLENNLIAGAFTRDRLVALELIAAQSAISMENSLLLSKEQLARAAAEEAARRSAFLARVSAILSESLDVEQTVARLARLFAGSVADWCTIDVFADALPATMAGDGPVRRLAGAHADPAKQGILATVMHRYPPLLDSPHPGARVLRTGKPVLLPDIPEDALSDLCVDEVHTRLARELGTRTGLAVPLVVRGQTFGAISLASGAPGRHFGVADVELAQEVARRAAAAVDNARLYSKAQEAVRLRDEFLSTASHELRTPVTSLQLVVQSMAREAREGRGCVPLEMVLLAERQTQRLTALIQQLLDVTLVRTGQLGLAVERFELVAETRAVLERLRPQFERATSQVTLHATEPIVGRWDRSRIDQLLNILLSNAVTYGAGKPVDLTVARVNGRVRITIHDRGIGIAPDRIAHIFERFGRAASARHYGGLGLGLFFARQIVEGHHGTISVESEPGSGSSFIVDLPLEPPGSIER